MRRLLLSTVLMILVIVCAGCGGQKSHDISTGGTGSFEGVRTIPRDGDLGVPAGIEIRVYWPSGYEPPAEFSFVLKDSHGSRVLTHMRSGDLPYEWWFNPTYYLSGGERYRIELTSERESVNIYFWTAESRQGTHSIEDEPHTRPHDTPALEEHVIRTVR